ncbi:MAG TPA: CapA family protein [bacterium]|nr:CapA family protein [bacterium]
MKKTILAICAALVVSASAAGCQREAAGPTMTVIFVGDTGLGDQAVEFVEQYGLEKSFEKIRDALQADFIIGNAETPIAAADVPLREGEPWHPKQVPETAAVYKKEGFSAFSLANNHALDFGVEGLRQTIANLRAQGINTYGAGMSEAEARRPLILEKNGIRVGVLGYFHYRQKYIAKEMWYAEGDKPGVAGMSKKNLRDDIAALKGKVDTVVVTPHWGENYVKLKDKQKRLAQGAVTVGADLIIGHGPHMAHPVVMIDETPVLYSVGNFIWHSKGLYKKFKVEKYAYALVTKVVFDKHGAREIVFTPYHNDNRKVKFIPQPVDAARAKALFDELLAPVGKHWKMNGASAVFTVPR